MKYRVGNKVVDITQYAKNCVNFELWGTLMSMPKRDKFIFDKLSRNHRRRMVKAVQEKLRKGTHEYVDVDGVKILISKVSDEHN